MEESVSELQWGVVEATLAEIRERRLPEFQWLFLLVGRLRGTEPGLRARDKRLVDRFWPVAQRFAERILELGLAAKSKGSIDWADHDAVKLEFAEAWASRRLPKDSGVFERALEVSREDPLGLGESDNRWVSRLANLAFILSELLPETPNLIPVNHKTAEALGTSLRTLSLAMQELIRQRMVLVIEKTDVELPKRRARRLKFNSRHPRFSPDIDGARKRLRDLLQRAG